MLHSLLSCPEPVYKGTLFPDVLPLAKNSDCFFRLSEILPGVSSGTGPQFPKSTVTRLPNRSHAVSAFSCKCYAALASIRSEKSTWVTMNVSSDSQDGQFFFLQRNAQKIFKVKHVISCRQYVT